MGSITRIAVALSCLWFVSFCFAVTSSTSHNRHKPSLIPDQYIVVFKDDSLPSQRKHHIHELAQKSSEASIFHVYHFAGFSGYSAKLSPQALESVANSSIVDFIEQNQVVWAQDFRVSATIPVGDGDSCGEVYDATWGLDRIDQRDADLSKTYSFGASQSVTAYVVDTGIEITHPLFEGRATYGANFVDNTTDANDCNGHGTHVAGTIGSNGFGVAEQVNLVAVKVLNCEGSGTTDGVIAGVDWVASNAKKPSVSNLSLGGGISSALDKAIEAAIQAGTVFVVAAGNENRDACLGSPSRVPAAITVGATNIPVNSVDNRASFSNFGSCVDVFAPGQNITSTWLDDGMATISGTSMASPHVAGVAALLLAQKPSATPEEIAQIIINAATSDIIQMNCRIFGACNETPNRMLYVNECAAL